MTTTTVADGTTTTIAAAGVTTTTADGATGNGASLTSGLPYRD
jgi:hypothetical protein